MNATEQRNPKTMGLDKMSASEIVSVMNEENAFSVTAVGKALPQIAKAVDAITEAFSVGGRLIYLGAGTSGRLAVADAAECPPTFGAPYEQVIALCAGGERTMFRAAEGEEDDPESGVEELKKHHLCDKDVVVGISASGGAAYVVNALRYARSVGCVAICVVCNVNSPMERESDIAIVTETGAEVLTGSTRLKAGNAQKMVLNMLSTASMVRSGHVYENMMINLKPTNIKLRDRVIRIVVQITALEYAAAEKLLERADWVIRDAIQLWKQEG